MSLYLAKTLISLDLEMERDELMLWDIMHDAGIDNFAALRELDDDAIRSIAVSKSAAAAAA